jgi:hypothetical protein
MSSEFDNSIYLDFHLAELQLFVTQFCTTSTKFVIFSVRYSGSWILFYSSWQTNPHFTSLHWQANPHFTSLAGESSCTGPVLYCYSWQTNPHFTSFHWQANPHFTSLVDESSFTGPALVLYCTALPGRRILTSLNFASLAGESSFTGPALVLCCSALPGRQILSLDEYSIINLSFLTGL